MTLYRRPSFLQSLCGLLTVWISTSALAGPPQEAATIAAPASEERALVAEYESRRAKIQGPVAEQSSSLLPTRLSPIHSLAGLTRQMSQHLAQRAVKSATNSESSLFRGLQRTLSSLQTGSSLSLSSSPRKNDPVRSTTKTTKSSTPPTGGGNHTINFQLDLARGLAKVKYAGALDTDIQYQVSLQRLVVRSRHHLNKASSLRLTHEQNAQGSTQRLSYSYSW